MTIELDAEEVKLLKVIQKHQELFNAILEAKVHDLKRGEAVLSFDHEGNLMKIDVRTVAYRKK